MADDARRILYLHASAELYGADRTLLDLIEPQVAGRGEVMVVLPRPGPLVRVLRERGARVEIGPLGVGAQASISSRGLLRLAFELPRALFFVRRLAREFRPDLIHTNTMIALGAALAARTSGVPHLWHVHEIPLRPRWLTRLFAHLFALLADRVVFNSHATAEHFQRRNPALGRRARVVWNGTASVADDEDVRRRERENLGLAPHEPLILLPGRINAWKGQGLLLETARRLRDRHPAARYAIVGDVPPGQDHFARELRARRKQMGLEKMVHILPFRSDPSGLYRAADVVVVPSLRPEPFGLVAIEAMAVGCPVVAADHGGLAEIVRDGKTGLLFEPGSADALADVLDHLLSEPEDARRMGLRARERQREYFTLERYREGMGHLHDELVGKSVVPALPARTKIVHVTLGKANPDRMNGVNHVVHHLATAQHRGHMRVEVWGLTSTPAASTVPREYPLRLFGRARGRFRLGDELARAIDAERAPCLFHLHGGLLPEMHAVARRLVRRGHSYVLTPHGAYRPVALAKRRWAKAIYRRWFERFVVRHARAVHVFTSVEAADVPREFACAAAVVLPNGQAVPSTLPPATSTSSPRPIFGFCGRLDAHTKGLDLLLDGFARYLEEGGAGSLHVIGDGPDAAALSRRVVRSGTVDRVRFLGPRFGEEKLAHLRGFDVFCLTSRHEGMPTSALEAAAVGLPLLLSEETNVTAEVDAHVCGLVLPANTVEDIARTMHGCDVLRGSGELAVMGARAAAMAAEVFSWERVARASAAELYGLPAPAREPDQLRGAS